MLHVRSSSLVALLSTLLVSCAQQGGAPKACIAEGGMATESARWGAFKGERLAPIAADAGDVVHYFVRRSASEEVPPRCKEGDGGALT